jgi:DNA-binding CsgD family transcriptional regulator
VATHYGLTPAEARLAVTLVEGKTLEEAVQLLDITVHTARTQLRSVFAKTETHRQPELIALLLCGVLGQCRSGQEKT